MENPSTWSPLTTFIFKACKEHREMEADGVIGASLYAYLERRLQESGLLKDYSYDEVKQLERWAKDI